MKYTKRLLALFLAAVLMLGSFCIVASAEVGDYEMDVVAYFLDELESDIRNYGGVNGYGEPMLQFDANSGSTFFDNKVYFFATQDGVLFSYRSDYQAEESNQRIVKETTIVELLHSDDLQYANVTVEMYGDILNFKATTTLDVLNYEMDEVIPYNVNLKDSYTTRQKATENANTMFDSAFMRWRAILYQELGYYISQFGFSNYCPGHTETSDLDYKPTCTENGLKETVCYYCGLVMDEQIIPATGHKWNQGVTTKAATCSTSGLKTLTCTACGETKNQTIPATGAHSYITKTKAATTKANGSTSKTCSVCGAVSKKKTIRKIDSVTLNKTTLTYSGKVQHPTVTVKDSAGNIINSKYYTVSYSKGCTNVGSYKVKVTFKGLYSGKVNLSFKIVPARVKDLNSTSKKAGTATLKWSPAKGAQEYAIYCSTAKNSGYKQVAVTTKTSYTVKNLKSQTIYYFIVQSYAEANGVKIPGAKSNRNDILVK